MLEGETDFRNLTQRQVRRIARLVNERQWQTLGMYTFKRKFKTTTRRWEPLQGLCVTKPVEGLKSIIPMLGINIDSGSEFINKTLAP